MSQVILDSDEEDGINIEEHVQDSLVSDNKPIGVTTDPRDGVLVEVEQTINMRATSSSEKLRREIEIAQLALLEPTPSGKRHTADDLDAISFAITPQSPRSKRRKSTASEAGGKQKILKTKHVDTVDTVSPMSQPSPQDTIMDSSSSRGLASSHLAVLGTSTTFRKGSDNNDNSVSTPLQTPTASDVPLNSDMSGSQVDELQTETLASLGAPNKQQPVVIVPSKANQDPEGDPKPSIQRTKKKKSDHEASVDELGPDEVLSPPKETYNARSTRSRTAVKEPDQPASALPATPAKISNSKLKRLRAPGSIAQAKRSTLCEMGFGPSQADEALVEADGDVNRAIELLTKRGQEVPKTRKTRASRAQRRSTDQENDAGSPDAREGEPFKSVDVGNYDQDEEIIVQPTPKPLRRSEATNLEDKDGERGIQKDHEDSPSNSADELYASTRSAATRKSARANGTPKKEQDQLSKAAQVTEDRETVNHERGDIEPATEQQVGDNPVNNEPKKRGRGRPKKEQQSTEQHAECIIVVDEEANTEAASRQVLGVIDANEGRPAVSPEKESQTASAGDGHNMKVTPEKNTKTTSASPKKAHSPLNSGKVPFKVGLSRRVRIEPLLRIVKK